MRRRAHFASLALLAVTAIGVSHAGCIVSLEYPDEKLDEPRTIPNPTPSGCVPSERDTWTAAQACGVFVSNTQGHDDNDGTPGKPVKSLKQALLLAESKSKRVYACAEEFDEAETVEVPAGMTLYGGLTCDKVENGLDWRWVDDTTRTKLSAPSGTIPLKITGKNSPAVVHLENVHVIAKPIRQGGSAEPVLSSIALVASAVRLVELKHSMLEAGDAAPGLEGEPYEQPASPGAKGNPGEDACSGSTVNSGETQFNDCGTPDETDDSFGGAGGAGRPDTGDPGVPGYPNDLVNGGTGQVGTTACTSGQIGGDGTNGEPGSGATGDGSITPEGYIGASGAPGTSGTTAQGGGGGGGARGVPMTTTSPRRSCPDGTPPLGGASGGSGGAGGCGGAGGRGGGPGGASIALISINTEISFDGVTLKTGNGGNGGNGGPGQDGGMGGMGGPRGEAPDGTSNLLHGCDGGPGGIGGNGGTGGGGRGGHSVGIAFQGKPPALTGVTFELGAPGNGGTGGDAGHNGENGRKADRFEF
ncbi:PGRS family protein [Sorangium sp. So ce726]|uniref:PGRS family protein n=1 Tax=Sorangium sp. So ce726 TaxID=3133319 RepID=UPI003F5DC113